MKVKEDDGLVKELVENNVTLQKTTLEMIDSVNKLTERIDRMLNLFEEAAKKIEEAEALEEEGPLKEKLEALLEQNKVIARGLVLLERFIRDKTSTGFMPSMPSTYHGSSLEPKKLEKAV